MAHALRAVHRGPSLPARFNSFRVVEDYRTTAFSHGAEVPPSYAWARQVARRVERARGAFAERPCHNDLLNANFIDDGRRLRIVDWEYAGMGDVFFDLANFSINHELDRDGREALLEAYFGEVRASNERALELMLFMSDFREAMWGVIQGAMSELDFDFARLRRRALRAHGGRRPPRRRSSARSSPRSTVSASRSAAVPEHGGGRRGLRREADQRDRLEPSRCVPHVTMYRLREPCLRARQRSRQ